MPLPAFHPSDLSLLIEDLASPTLSLAQVAERHNTSLDSLSLYLTTSEALLHIANAELAAALRIRLAAQIQLHHAVQALTTSLKSFNEEAAKPAAPHDTPTAPTTTSITPLSSITPDAALREQQRSNARRAAHLLFRLATFTPRSLAGIAPPAHQPPHAREPGPARSTTPAAPTAPAPAARNHSASSQHFAPLSPSRAPAPASRNGAAHSPAPTPPRAAAPARNGDDARTLSPPARPSPGARLVLAAGATGPPH